MTKALLTILLFAALATAAAQEWTRISPTGCRCSLLTPVKMEEETKTVNDPKAGPYTSYLFKGATGGVGYLLVWVDYSPDLDLDIQGEMEANRDNFVRSWCDATPDNTYFLKWQSWDSVHSSDGAVLLHVARVHGWKKTISTDSDAAKR